VVGDPPSPFYAVYTNGPGQSFQPAAFHPNDRYIVVLQGTWWVGTGPKFDPANTTPMPTGEFRDAYRASRCIGMAAKDEEPFCLIMGEGRRRPRPAKRNRPRSPHGRSELRPTRCKGDAHPQDRGVVLGVLEAT